jgi:type IV pilus assembly protein PilC
MKIPVMGLVYRNYLTVKVMSTFSLLLGSGISIVKTLKLTGASTDNVVVQDVFRSITEAVSHGKRIAESMKEADPHEYIFTNNILQMIESAEKTSTINTVANKISLQYRREVDTSLAIMVKFIEPIALVFAAVFVLWFAIAIFSAIMQVVSTA